MNTPNFLKWATFTLFLVFHAQIDDPLVATVPIPPFAPRPLCNFQLALANQACAYLPSLLSPPPPPPPTPPFAAFYPAPPPSSEDHEHVHRHRHHHHHHHALGHEVDDGNAHNQNQSQNHDHGHGHHRHSHRHHHKHRMSPIEQQCCKWLAQVDDECVCELLNRLPPFLARPIHEYTVRVAGSCNTTYFCAAGWLRV